MKHQIFAIKSMFIVTALILVIVNVRGAMASTQAGEMVVLEANQNRVKARIMFCEYFSSPREFYPGQIHTGTGSDWVIRNYTVTYIDGRYVKQSVFLKAMLPGRRYYQYTSRSTMEFLHIYTHDLPTIGHMVKMDGRTVTLRRFMIRRFDTGTPVFRNMEVEIANDALYMVDGSKASERKVLNPSQRDRQLIRVFPARPQTLSVFRNESLATNQDFDKKHTGGQTGQVLRTGKVKYNGKPLDGVYLNILKEGKWTETPMAIDRKGYAVMDGRYMPWRSQAINNSVWATAAVYRGWTKAKYMMLRSKALGAVDGVIKEVSGNKIKVQLLGTDKVVNISYDGDTRILLDAMNSSGSKALKVGRQITIYNKRPQVVEAITGCPRQSEKPSFTISKKDRPPMTVIEYRADNQRRVIREGYYPLMDTSAGTKSDYKTRAGVAYPPKLKGVAPEVIRGLTPEEGPFYWTIPDLPPAP